MNIKDDGMLIGSYKTISLPIEALMDYVSQIKGKTLIVEAYSGNRLEFQVPSTIEA